MTERKRPKLDMVELLHEQCEDLRMMRIDLARACEDLEQAREASRVRPSPFDRSRGRK